MKNENYTYSEKAANWWANKIIEELGNHVPGISFFEELLEKEIRCLNNRKGSLTISTYRTRSLLLDRIAVLSNLNVEIPKGYEMKILVDSVSVYNFQGTLVANF